MQLLFTSPVSRPALYGGGTISGVSFRSVLIDPDGLTASAAFSIIEDGLTATPKTITVSITGNMTMNQLLAAFKAAIATAVSVTFQ